MEGHILSQMGIVQQSEEYIKGKYLLEAFSAKPFQQTHMVWYEAEDGYLQVTIQPCY
jgi:hypothetical protein